MANDKACFVIAPVGEEGTEERARSDRVLRYVIRPAVEKCGYSPTRADEISEPGLITTQIIERLLGDDLVIADMTGQNANVFYELALRHAFRKPVILLIRVGERIPFDVAGMRTVSLDHQDLESVDRCKEEITAQIEVIDANPDSVESPVTVAANLRALSEGGDLGQRASAQILAAVQASRREVLAGMDRLTRVMPSVGGDPAINWDAANFINRETIVMAERVGEVLALAPSAPSAAEDRMKAVLASVLVST